MGVAAELIQVLSDLQVITGLLNNVLNTSNQTASKQDIAALGQQVLAQLGLVENMLIGLAAQERQIWADLSRQIQGLGVQTGIPQQATQPVILPTTPPAGYGSSLDAAGVWSYVQTGQIHTTGQLLAIAGWVPIRQQAVGAVIPLYDWPFIGWGGPWDEPTFADPNFANIPYLDWTTISSGDASTLAWLDRVYAGVGWYDAGGGMVAAPSNDGQNVAAVLISPARFAELKALANPTTPTTPLYVPPVFPGVANVTYGDSQSMDAPNGSLSGPADGYKIEIDAVPSWAGKFDFGAVQSWRNVGAIAFVDDEGVPEPPQTLGITPAHYVPRSMAHSVGAYYRIATGYHAAATPFTINP